MVDPIKLPRNFVLDVVPLKNGVVDVWMPGGTRFKAPLPRDSGVNMLPRAIPWVRRLAIAHGFYLENQPLTVMAYDIETIVPGASPNPDRDTLKSLSWWMDNELWCKDCETDADRKQALEMFVTAVQYKNPDVLMDYFGTRYDMPVLINEANRLGVSLALGRDGSEVELIQGQKKGRWGYMRVVITGRVHFDVFGEACNDQSLDGVRKGLKPVAQHLGIKNIIIEDVSDIEALASEARMLYNVSDARLTYILGTMYLMSLSALADKMRIPLSLTVSRGAMHFGDYMYGRNQIARGVEWGGTNQDRFPVEFGRRGKKYQGGHVELLRTGLFRDVKKLDFNSLYPSTMAMFNMDPLTLTKIRTRPYVDLPPKFYPAPRGTCNPIIEISDEKLGRIALDLDNTCDSMTRVETLKLLRLKNELKPMSKIDPKAASNYWVVKRLLNANYGYHGAPWSNYGHFPIAYLTCSLGRWFVTGLRDLMAFPIGVDTDGVVGGGEDDMEAIELTLQERIPDYYMRDLLKVDEDRIDAILSVDEKNYITQERGKIKIHGSGLKGRHIPYAVATSLRLAIEALFNGEDPYTPVKDFVAKFPELRFREFQLNQDFGKALASYSPSAMMGNLGRQLKAAGVDVQVGDSCYYVKVEDGYCPTQLVGDRPLDMVYYRKRVAKIIARALSAIEPIKPKEVLKKI